MDDQRDREPATSPEPPLEDERAVADARRLLRRRGAIAIEPDDRIAVMLAAGERVLARRDGATVEQSTEPGGAVGGRLYLTSDRLLLLGDRTICLPLEEIEEAEVLELRLVLRIRDASEVAIRVGDARLLRMEIGVARAAARAVRPDQAPR